MSVNKGAGHSFNGQSIGVWAHWFDSLLSGGISGDAEVPRHSIFMMVYPCTKEHSLNWGGQSADENGEGGVETIEQIENNVSVMTRKKKKAYEPRVINTEEIIVIYQFVKIILWSYETFEAVSCYPVCVRLCFITVLPPDTFSHKQKTEHIALDSRDDLSLLAGRVVDSVFQMDSTLFAPRMLGWTPVPCVSSK